MKQRKDGRWQGKVLIGVVDGKYRYKYVYGKTKREVTAKLAELRVELGKGADLTQTAAFRVWAERWLARAEQRQTEEWHATVRSRTNLWIEALGDRDVRDITTADLEDVLLRLAKRNPVTGNPSAKKTLTEYRAIVVQIFAYCRQNRILSFDPTEFLPVDRTAPKAVREAVSDMIINKIKETPHEAQLPCLIMLYCGLRLGELAAITWTDVDIPNRLLTVNKSMNFKSGKVKAPKTAAGTRTVPVPEVLVPYLEAAPRASLLVCPHRGHTYTRAEWEYALASYSRLIGEDLRAHTLRHTCCTLYYEAGVDVLQAQRWMGHADPQTTIGIYTHLREASRSAAAVRRLNAHLSADTQLDTHNSVK